MSYLDGQKIEVDVSVSSVSPQQLIRMADEALSLGDTEAAVSLINGAYAIFDLEEGRRQKILA
jgi:hypothetical protein